MKSLTKKSVRIAVSSLIVVALAAWFGPAFFLAVKAKWDVLEPALGLVDTMLLSVGGAGLIWAFWLKNRRYQGIALVAIKNGKEVGRKGLSADKAKEIDDDEWQRTLVLKGFSSTFGWLNIDVLEITSFDEAKKEWRVDLDLNPKSKPRGPSPELKKLGELEEQLTKLSIEHSELKALLEELLS